MSNASFTVWDTRTGNIIRTGDCPESWVPAQVDKEWEAVCVGTKGIDTQWHDGRRWRAKKSILPKIDGTKFSKLPKTCRCTVEGIAYEVSDGVADFEFSQPGKYIVKIEARGHRPATFEVTA